MRAVFFVLAFFVVFGALEAVLRLHNRSATTHIVGGFYSAFAQDSITGYAIRERGRTYPMALLSSAGDTLYDVAYGFDPAGHRITPVAGSRAVLFFGDSFMFGAGVRDEESLPYQFSMLTGRRAVNLAFHGWGPHQMLRMLETRSLGLAATDTPTVAVYGLLPEHMDRAAGRTSWDVHGPRYELAGDSAVYRGHFSDRPFARIRSRILGRSLAYGRTAEPLMQGAAREHDAERVAAILSRSQQLLKQYYNARLVVLLWDCPARLVIRPSDAEFLEDALYRRGIEALRLSKAAPALCAKEAYIPIDGHPTAATQRRLAELLAKRLP